MTDDLCLRPATELSALLRGRELSAVELLEACLARIEQVNPQVNAVVTLDADGARARARAADDARARGEDVGPLHGLPYGVKDTHETAGLRTTWGSPVRADHVPERDELVVARAAAAGAVRVGKTNVPEFAAGSHTTNPVFGPTRNPYDLGRSAGGSSGGSAAALAAGMVALADGSDMGGSLRNPAAFCNVVGLRPSAGRVPSHPAPFGWSTLSVQGPMGRTVADVALGLSALAGPDARVPLSLQDDGAGFAAPLPERLDGLRVAWTPDLGGLVPVEPEVLEALRPTVGLLEGLGARVEETCPDLRDADEAFHTLRAWLFAANLGDVVDQHPDQVKETIHWNVGVGRRLTGADVARAELAHTRLHEEVVRFFGEFDVLLAPVTQVVPFDVDVEYPTVVAGRQMPDYLGWMRSVSLISATGCPALSVPGGFTPAGLPVGLQVIAAPRADRRVLEVGHAIEQATGHWRRHPAL